MPVGQLRYAAVILTGGGASRMGGVDKTALEVAGDTVLTRVLSAVDNASEIVVAGPRPRVEFGGGRVAWVLEDPPLGGPVAGIDAAVASLRSTVVVVLAGDLPFADGLPAALLDALSLAPSADAVVPQDVQGRWQPLAAVYRTEALRVALRSIGDTRGQSARTLLKHLRVVAVLAEELPANSLFDIDTQSDLEEARNRLRTG